MGEHKGYAKKGIGLKIVILFLLPLLLTNLPFITAFHENNPTFPTSTRTQRYAEALDRGLVAYNQSNGDIYLSWRFLQVDPAELEFDVYMSNLTHPSIKLNGASITQTTDFLYSASDITPETEFWVVAHVGGLNPTPSKKVHIANRSGENYISIGLQGDSKAREFGVGDLDGDKTLDYIIHTPSNGTDPANSAWHPTEVPGKIEAYLSNGTLLWTFERGWDIEMGTWYTPYVVYDLDGDGISEVILKAGEIGGDHRDLEGRVASGPEYLLILNGSTGEEITRAPWISRWYENYSNLARNQLGVAYLDGINPYIIVARGTYEIMKVKAYAFQNQMLEEVWHWESGYEYGTAYTSQGAHTMTCYDVDNDGNDEIILGSCVLDETGNGLWSTGFTHSDLAYVGDLDPIHPGLEIFYAIEGSGKISIERGYGLTMVDAATGEVIWAKNTPTEHMHGGVVSDISTDYPGAECYATERDNSAEYLFSPQGELIAQTEGFDYSSRLKAIYWDADIQRELFHYGNIWNHDSGEHHITIENASIYELGIMDILGDWREEVIITFDGEVRIYGTNITAEDRNVCLLQDSLYRNDVAHSTMGYAPSPTTSYGLAYPDADKTPSENWVNEYESRPTLATKVHGAYRKYHFLLKAYLSSILVTAFIIFQKEIFGWVSSQKKKFPSKIGPKVSSLR